MGIAKVSATGDLKGTVVLRDEKKRFAETNVFPEKDEDSDSASVKAIRASIRVQLARLETANATRAKAVHAKYDAVFAQAQTQLTQRQRFDDALLVQAKRDEVKAAWITPAIAAAAEKANALAPAPAQPAIPLKVAAKQTPAPAKGVANDDDVTKALVGTWHLHWAEPGYDADYVFRADGTFTGRPVLRSGKEHNGTWKVTGNKIQMEAPKTGQKTIHLPIDPMGTNIFDHYKDWHILAVKKK